MQIYDLDGKPVKALSELTRAVRARAGRSQKSEVIPLVPGSYNLVTKGRGVPGPGIPKRCLVCRKLVKVGDRWVSIDNGEYSTIRHESCK